MHAALPPVTVRVDQCSELIAALVGSKAAGKLISSWFRSEVRLAVLI